jgi:hypothetical protein|tara:strand:- start:1203 stop:2735 length:1533 start_codon:yes stop_codon:yes gene_type:complete
MPIDIFGFSIGKKTDKKLEQVNKSFVEPDIYDGAHTLEDTSAGGFFGSYVDFLGTAKTENDLVGKYRAMALFPEVDQAVEDIVNDAIVVGPHNRVVDINLDHTKLSDNIKQKVTNEFEYVISLLDFNNRGYEVFKRWYIDGKLYYHIILHGEDAESIRRGISEIRAVDPVKIRKIRKVTKEKSRTDPTAVPLIKNIEEFFLFTDTTPNSLTPTNSSGIKIDTGAICYVNSGVIDSNTKRVMGYLHKAIRPLNMLRQIEDAVVIYRISRAPERRIFYIDVGNLPKQKAEQYLKDIMNRYRNKLMYNASTGEISDGKDHLSMLEDYWIPRKEGGKSTEITTLDGGQNLGEMEDVLYLQKKLFRALNVPLSRLETESGFNLGRSTEITRDEIKFSKFVSRLRSKFAALFTGLLKVQLISKGIVSSVDWKTIEQQIKYKFQTDSYFQELKEMEILKEKMDVMRELQEYVGTYFSKEYIKKKVLNFTDEELLEIEGQIQTETQEEPKEESSEEDF